MTRPKLTYDRRRRGVSDADGGEVLRLDDAVELLRRGVENDHVVAAAVGRNGDGALARAEVVAVDRVPSPVRHRDDRAVRENPRDQLERDQNVP